MEGLDALVREHAELERRMADPALHADAAAARRVGRRYAELAPIVRLVRELDAAQQDLGAARELGAEDPELAGEAEALEARCAELTEELEELLAPRDADDARDVILEVKAGAGGEESALFAADLVRMYRQYATAQGWTTEVITSSDSDLGGFKDATVSIRAAGSPAPADGVWAHLKYEGGVHRVQRVPVTESQGRIHTSAVGVLVMPEADETDEAELLADQMAPANLRIDVFRSSGPGGQSVNTTDSAVRITHLPTGIVVSCQNEKSQLQNKESALRILRSRLLEALHAAQDAEASAARRSQVRTVDRSERIRTYNFPENRIADHRTGYKANNLDQVLAGDLGPVIRSAQDADRAAMLASAQERG
ncbi:peptide chain release factor 1 [Brachybacterium huguangmaarense]|uniref:Peptide chain release factor 1 n=1 Tax=Brachybacterium huguangmaarense TaxID=1652028 RepID=A0ABY6FYF3_9MICO|nr:peptide chain release factor 1 [Brachybacterium huguangmaarense]UYG15967.1 peptide chain release factor 1 [Brachybacterium huguangmaarense]